MFKKDKIKKLLQFGLVINLLLLILIIAISLIGISQIKTSFITHHFYMENSFNRLELVKILFSINNKMQNWQNFTKQHILAHSINEKQLIEKEINNYKNRIFQDLDNYQALINENELNKDLVATFKKNLIEYEIFNYEILRKSFESSTTTDIELSHEVVNTNYLEASDLLNQLINSHVNNSINEQELSFQFYNQSINTIKYSIIIISILGSLAIIISAIKGGYSINTISTILNSLATKEKALTDSNERLTDQEKQLKAKNIALIKAKDDLEQANRELIIINKSLRELDDMKNNFISTVSHELRTPLTSIKGSLGLVLNDIVGDVRDEVKAFLKVSYKNTDTLIALINEILDLAKLESGKIIMHKNHVFLNDIITDSIESVSSYAVDKEILLFSEIDNKIQIYADKEKVKQVMANLLSNAIKFSPTESGTKGIIKITATTGDKHVQVNIQDNGIGIPDDKLSYIFEKFTQIDASSTRQREGTGLGLAICKAIIEEHRGIIWADNKQPQGVTFSFTVPSKELQEQYDQARKMLDQTSSI
jgi:signal transduction histidine kinase